MQKHGTKTIPIFLPVDGEVSWLLLPSFVSLLSGDTVQPENILYPQGDQSGLRRPKPTGPKPVSTDVTVKSNSVLTNPVETDRV